MNFLIINQETFQIYLYTILIQGISSVFKGQIPTYLVFSEVHSMLAYFSTVYNLVTILKNDMAKLKAVLRMYLHTHFYLVDEFFYV